MMVIGLTGGMGMGKSTVANMFTRCGIPAFNADDAVHELQAAGGKAIPALARAFPGTVRHGVLNRTALRGIVLRDPAALHRLEQIMHPLVHKQEAIFRKSAYRAGRRAVLLDSPLLFETGGELRVDVSITVSAPRDVQLMRLKRRGKMSLQQIKTLIAKQMPDAMKRAKADYVIHTGLSRFHTFRAVRRLVKILLP